MDEQTNALVQTLKEHMDREIDLFNGLGEEVERLRDSFQKKVWGSAMAITGCIERSARGLEDVEAARDEAFTLLRGTLDLPRETTMSAILPSLPDEQRRELESSWRELRMSVVRLKTAASRMRYAADTMSTMLNRVLEQVFPYRKGRLYSRKGTPTSVSGGHIIDHRL